MKKTITRTPDTLDAFKTQTSRLPRDRLIALKADLVDERARVKAELREISSTGMLKGEAREFAKNACIKERDLLGAKIAYVIHLLGKMKRIRQGLRKSKVV